MKSYLYVFGFLLVVPMLAPNPGSLRSKDPEIVRSVATSEVVLEEWETIRAYISRYCATSSLCNKPICGGNRKTSWGKDATKAGGVAVDPRRIPYGSIILIDGKRYVADDTGSSMRRAWRKKGITHIDIRIAGFPHEEVRKLGVDWKMIKVLRRKNGR